MIAKILAFVLLGIGGLVALGLIAASIPSIGNTAMTIGEHAISWSKVAFAGMFGVVCWITSKV